MRAQRDRKARVFRRFGYSGSALGMARRDDRQQRRMFCAQLPVRGDDLVLFAGMRRGSRDHRARQHDAGELAQGRRIGRRSRHVELEIADIADARRAELTVTLCVAARLRQAKIETRQQRGDRLRQEAPALERTLRHPAVDQDHRDFAFSASEDEIGPQVGTRRTAPDRAASDRGSAPTNCGASSGTNWWTAPAGRRCSASAADVTVPDVMSTAKFFGAQTFDQRDDREHLADAGAMQPNERSTPAAAGSPVRNARQGARHFPCRG